MTVIQGKNYVNQQTGEPTPLVLRHHLRPSGEVAVEIGGELDVDTADQAFGYVAMIINHYRGPVVVSLAGVDFCDARGLRALVRMVNHAEQADCPFRVTSPSARLVMLMRLTGLEDKFPAAG